MSDPNKDPLPQGAFRKKPVTDEDKFFAEEERKRLETLKAQRSGQKEQQQRLCLNAECQGQPLEALELHGVEIDRCPKCGGVWLDPGELELLTSDKRTSKNPVARFFHNLAGNYDE